MHISKLFNLNTTGHKNIDFIDIDEVKDTKLFLDPYVIQALDDAFCIEAQKSINSFFRELFIACKSRNGARLRELLEHSSEPNETNLGMKTKSIYGKGATAGELSTLFFEFYKLVSKNPTIESNPLALCMYIKNFDKDKMSDLITNIIRKQLYIFTVEQANKHNIALTDKTVSLGYYWNYKSLVWEELKGKALCTNHRIILLVPKIIVRSRYIFNIECYIKQYILKVLQTEHLNSRSDLCTERELKDGKVKLIPPTIEYLYEKEVNGTTHKDYAFNYSKSNKTLEDVYLKNMLSRIKKGDGKLSDNELDKLVYGNTYEIAS